VIKNRFAHGPAVVQVPTAATAGGKKKFVMYHIGDGLQTPLPVGLLECTNGTTPAGVMPRPSYTDCGKPLQVKTRTLVAESILGPWENDTVLGCGDENASPFIFEDGSAMYLNRFGSLDTVNNCTDCPGMYGAIHRASATHYEGPYVYDDAPLFPGCSDPCVEDSNVYRVPKPPNTNGKNRNANVGSFHSLFHGRTHQYQGKGNGEVSAWAGRHAWSSDPIGKVWYMSPYAAFSMEVLWQGGGSTTFSARERPHVLWQGGQMTHLSSGVESGPSNCLDCSVPGRNEVHDYAYTLVQPISTSTLIS